MKCTGPVVLLEASLNAECSRAVILKLFHAMEPVDFIKNITEPLFKLILNTIKEMFYLTKLMS